MMTIDETIALHDHLKGYLVALDLFTGDNDHRTFVDYLRDIYHVAGLRGTAKKAGTMLHIVNDLIANGHSDVVGNPVWDEYLQEQKEYIKWSIERINQVIEENDDVSPLA